MWSRALVCGPLVFHLGRSVPGRKEGKVSLGGRGNSLDQGLKVKNRITAREGARSWWLAQGLWQREFGMVVKGLGDACQHAER